MADTSITSLELFNSSSPSAASIIVPGVPKPLTYTLPDELSAGVGSVVRVEVGRQVRTGWVVDFAGAPIPDIADPQPEPSRQLGLFTSDCVKPRLKAVLSGTPAFTVELLELFRWMAAYYGSPISDVLEMAIPLPRHVIAELDRKFLPKKRRSSSRRSSRAVRSTRVPTPSLPVPELTPEQSGAVESIVKAIGEERFSPFLLFGVTGSGKTEVYIRAILQALNRGKSALVVVPEIALTPQLFDYFAGRLHSEGLHGEGHHCEVGLLHSEVGDRERWDTWQRILRGDIRVVLGARSAIFAPLHNLGLVIVDEEHDGSYKQGEGIRYHARDVALIRAKLSASPVILGSATPSFESLFNATRRRYHLLEMPSRVSTRPLPKIEVVNLREVRRRDMPTDNISPRLHALIGETLGRNEQVIILYNRRGFSSYPQCGTCGEVLSCPNCSVTLTFHRKRQIALCHYCDYSVPVPSHCANCRDPKRSRYEGSDAKEWEDHGKFLHLGGGTERVVGELAELFPEARILQMDRDTVTRKDAYREILSEMRSERAQILVGTQMIAKGHDLPGVTLVGIINADVGLHLPDFRSSEKIFQLITQAAGRAGRGEEPGRVIIQTREPSHPTIVATVLGRFKAFARFELDQRKRLEYPPFGRLLRLVVSSPDKREAYESATLVARMCRELLNRGANSAISEEKENSDAQILGPSQAPQERLRGRYRFHLLIKCRSPRILSQLAGELNRWKSTRKGKPDFRLVTDIDPVEML